MSDQDFFFDEEEAAVEPKAGKDTGNVEFASSYRCRPSVTPAGSFRERQITLLSVAFSFPKLQYNNPNSKPAMR